MAKDKNKLDLLIDSLNKEFGKTVIYKASDPTFNIERISTGSLILDDILGGGFARGRITELFGPSSSGKTTIAMHVLANIQRRWELPVLYANVEDTFDPVYARTLKMDLDTLVVYKPQHGEELVDVITEFLKKEFFGGIVVDSIAAMVPKKELEEAADKDSMGRAGKLTSSMMRKLVSANSSKTTIILINQIRDKIGVMYGKRTTTPGGKAISFFASQRLELSHAGIEKDAKKRPIARNVNVNIEKDKTGPNAHRSAMISLSLGKGPRISLSQEIIQLGKMAGLLNTRAGIITLWGKKYSMEEFSKRLETKQKFRNKLIKKLIKDGN